MATLGDLIERSEFEAQVRASAYQLGYRRGRHTIEKFVKAAELNATADPGLGADWVDDSLTNLDDNFRVGLFSREAYVQILLDAVANSAVAP